jgi:hypothetical protein
MEAHKQRQYRYKRDDKSCQKQFASRSGTFALHNLGEISERIEVPVSAVIVREHGGDITILLHEPHDALFSIAQYAIKEPKDGQQKLGEMRLGRHQTRQDRTGQGK